MGENVKGGDEKGRRRKVRVKVPEGAKRAGAERDAPICNDLQDSACVPGGRMGGEDASGPDREVRRGPAKAPEGSSPASDGLSDDGAQGPGRSESRPGGYYADFMTAQERKNLSAAIANSLEDEIAGLKVLNRRMFALFSEAETIREAVAIHKAYAASVSRILQLEKALRSLQDQNNLANEAFSIALTEVMQEMKIHI